MQEEYVGKEMLLEEAAGLSGKVSVCGIYSITNKVNGKVYVGLSKDVYTRAVSHVMSRGSNEYLQRSIAKYGIENFVHKVELLCTEEELSVNENATFDKYKNAGTVMYNIAKCGFGGNTLKYATEERKVEISVKMSGARKDYLATRTAEQIINTNTKLSVSRSIYLANRTAEEIAETNVKLSATQKARLANRTAEEITESNTKRNATLANRSAEEIAETNAKIKAGLASRTAEEITESNIRYKATLANRTAEEIAKTTAKISAKLSANNTAKYSNVVEDTIKLCLQNNLFTFSKYKKYCIANNLEVQVSISYFGKFMYFATYKEQLHEFVSIYKPNMDYSTYTSLCKLKPIPITNYYTTVKYSTYKIFLDNTCIF